MKEYPNTTRCEICGKILANSYMKDKHLQNHFLKGRSEGLEPHYIYNPNTGDVILAGMKGIED